MLQNKKDTSSYSYFSLLYDLVIPPDNFFRILKEQIDFSFVNELLREDYCEKFGRPAKEPEFMFKLLFIQRLKNFSDRELIEEVSQNLAYKFFLDLAPEDPVCDPSLLSKFRKKHIKEVHVLEKLLTGVLLQMQEKGLLKDKSLIVDATHTKSHATKENNTQQLQRLSKNLRRSLYKQDPDIRKKFPDKPEKGATFGKELAYTKKLLDVIEKEDKEEWTAQTQKDYLKLKKHMKMIAESEASMPKKGEWEGTPPVQSQVDPDAKTGYKSETNSFFGFKSHFAMTGDRIITGVSVSSGEASDGKYLKELVEQSEANGIEVKEVLGDAAYGSKENTDYLEQKSIEPYLRTRAIVLESEEERLKRSGMTYNKDADSMQCRAGHLAVKKNTSVDRGVTRHMYWFDIEKCKECPYKEGCYKPGSRTRTFSIKEHGENRKKYLKFQESESFKEKIRKRYMIEAKNAEMKMRHGLEYCIYRGLFGMQIQAYMTAIATNLKRMVRLLTIRNNKNFILDHLLHYLNIACSNNV